VTICGSIAHVSPVEVKNWMAGETGFQHNSPIRIRYRKGAERWREDLPTVRIFAGAVRAAFGDEHRIADAERLRGGSKKGVYRIILTEGSTAIVYIWDPDESFWPAAAINEPGNVEDVFSDASGLDLFLGAHKRLTSLDIAVVEDIRGGTLEALLEGDPGAAMPTIHRLAESLRVMQEPSGTTHGKVTVVESGETPDTRSCERVVYDRALGHLAEAARRDPRVGREDDRLGDTLHRLFGAVQPRSQVGLIHGELGPDHVLIDESGTRVDRH
jgi:hypothetical protein